MKISERDFRLIADYMVKNYGINLENKMALISGRLSNLAAKSAYGDIHGYIEHALNDPTGEELSKLVSRLTTNYTFFMREPQHYVFLENTVLPGLIQNSRGGDLRIWSAGCSSGEEPYSIAITVKRYLDSIGSYRNTRILATDISETVLRQAREGAYDEMQLKTLDPIVRDRYFTRLPNGQYQISNDIRQMVRLEKFNLMGDFSKYYHKFDAIFCRNVMIYFKNDTKKELAGKFYDVLEPGGYFFVGLSESLHNIETRFKFVKPAIYLK